MLLSWGKLQGVRRLWRLEVKTKKTSCSVEFEVTRKNVGAHGPSEPPTGRFPRWIARFMDRGTLREAALKHKRRVDAALATGTAAALPPMTPTNSARALVRRGTAPSPGRASQRRGRRTMTRAMPLKPDADSEQTAEGQGQRLHPGERASADGGTGPVAVRHAESPSVWRPAPA